MKEQLERDYKKVAEKLMDTLCLVTGKTVSEIYEIIKEVTEKDTKEQREFKNKDFHVKVWQDSEKIGIETVWIKKGFSHYVRLDNLFITISGNGWTEMRKRELFIISKQGSIENVCRLKTDCDYSYSDIVTELEKAHKLSSEVTIYDVIKECEGVTDRGVLMGILDKYEIISYDGYTYKLIDNRHYLGDPTGFVIDGYQLSLKEGE